MSKAAGIDLNGLVDVAAFDSSADSITGGAIPSVIVLPRQVGTKLTLIAGEEATRGVEGRGWNWPDSARVSDHGQSLRVPVTTALDCLAQDRGVLTSHGVMRASDMVAASVEALATSRGKTSEQRTVVAIPDNGTFDEEVQQKLIDSFVARGVQVTLLWRPVAALLGMAGSLNQHVERLSGKEIGVVSCLNHGLDVSKLLIHKQTSSGAPYIVPERAGSSIHVPYVRSIVDVGTELAEKIMAPYDAPGWQSIWGNGLVLRWLLGLPSKSPIIQTRHGWKRISGTPPAGLVSVTIDDAEISKIDTFLANVEYLIYEGPALEAPARGAKLVYYLSERLRDGCFRPVAGKSRTSLTFQGAGSHLAAKGCIEYQERQASERVTYYDHLPQIRLAVRRGNDPVFIPLIPEHRRVEGGKEYMDSQDLGLSIGQGANQLTFYVLREGNVAPRLAAVDLPRRVTNELSVKMTVRQRPAQGRARLTIEPLERNPEVGTIDVNWDRMQVLSDMTEEEILKQLGTSTLRVPSVQFQPCHPFLWAYERGGGPSLAARVAEFQSYLKQSPNDRLIPEVKAIRAHVALFAVPFLLTRRTHPEKSPHRSVSSDGHLPEPEEGLTETTLIAFDRVLAAANEWILNTKISRKFRDAIVLMASWTFLRCPSNIRESLVSLAEKGRVINGVNDFNAMGRCFSTEREIRAFYHVLDRTVRKSDDMMKNQHIYGLFHLLSLREEAPRYLSDKQARFFTGAVLRRLEEQRKARNFAKLSSTCLRAIAGLTRYRVVDPNFLSVEEDLLGKRAAEILDAVIRATWAPQHQKVNQLAQSTLEWLEQRGTDDNILQWDDSTADDSEDSDDD